MKVRTSAEVPHLSNSALQDYLRAMHEIRFFEDACHSLFAQGLVRGSTHLCQGQEAVSVGACKALEPTDAMTCTYRGHGAVLAKGAPLDRAFAEILGKSSGLCRGKGGSMHLTDLSVGAVGSFAVVGANLPISVGVAFASKYRSAPSVTLCLFGDGATNIGAFHESLNLAALWSLPVVFVIENNLYGEYSPLALTTPIDRLADRASSYGMPSERIDGNDVVEVYRQVAAAAAKARSGGGPTLIEAMTYRHKGHSRSDPATYRPDGELEEWLKRDPIVLLEQRLAAGGLSAEALAQIRDAAERAVDEALATAQQAPEPRPEERLEDVFA